MNPTGDKITAELQETVLIVPPAVITQGEVAEGKGIVEKTGEILEAGLEKTGEKLKAAGEMIGEKLSSTLAATEKTVQKVAEVASEETAKVELPGVVTFFQNGAARILGHLTTTTTTPVERIPTPPPPLQSMCKETVIIPEKNLVGDIITTDIQTQPPEKSLVGDIITTTDFQTQPVIHKPRSRVDVMKESGQLGPQSELKESGQSELKESGQLAPQSELHLPNLHVLDAPLNRAVEEPSLLDIVEQKPTIEPTPVAHPFPSFVPMPEQETAPSVTSSQQASNPLEYKDTEQQLLPNLTKKAVHDGIVFLEKVEQLDLSSAHRQKSKVAHGSEDAPKEQLPNLTTKAVHDGTAFIHQVEHQKTAHEVEHQKTAYQHKTVNDLPNLHAKDVQAGTRFLDVVENLDQHTS